MAQASYWCGFDILINKRRSISCCGLDSMLKASVAIKPPLFVRFCSASWTQPFRLASSRTVISGKSPKPSEVSKVSKVRYIPATAEQVQALSPGLDGMWHEQEVAPVLEGNFYDGEFMEGRWHGQGKLHLKDGTVYAGEFFEGRRNSKGTLTRPDGSQLVGVWENGRLAEIIAEIPASKPAQVSLQHKQYSTTRTKSPNKNTTTEPVPPKAILNNHASTKYPSTDSIHTHRTPHPAATIVHSTITAGKHEIQYSNGDMYTGEVVDGKKHGYGVLQFGDGGRYEGQWRDDAQHGQGTAVYPFGASYNGEWAHGLRHGTGTVSYADGQAGFTGEFRANKVHNGKGRYVSVSGAVFTGTWVEGLLEGKGSIWFSEHSHSEGEFRLGKVLNGSRVYRDAQGRVFKVTYSAGKQVKNKQIKQ